MEDRGRKKIGLKGLGRNQYFLFKQGIMIALVLFISCFFLQFHAFSQVHSNRFTIRLAKAPANEVLTALVYMKGDINITRYFGNRSKVLKHISDQTKYYQKNLASYLQEEYVKGTIKTYKQFWIVNAVLVEGKADILRKIEKRTDVQYLQENFALSMPEPQNAVSQNAASSYEWGIEKIDAPKVWSNYGYKGKTIRIGHLDTGVDATHNDIKGKINRWAVINEYGTAVPGTQAYDSANHGTHTAGILVGGNASGTYIGVAPEAELVSALVLPKGSGSFTQVLGGMEWVIDPDNNPSTDDSVDVLSLSLGADGLYEEFIDPINKLIAANIFPAISIGNSGPETSSSPGNVPEAFSVGAVNSSDQVASFSSGEQVQWNVPPYVGVWVKPDICAPGSSIRSSVPGGYSWMSGTSMAAPHVAGAVALIKQANPNLTVAQIKTILAVTSKDLGSTGKDTRYGWGLINVYEAVTLAMSGDIPDNVSEFDPEKPWAYIISPRADQIVWGDAVSIMADATANTSKVIFQYKSQSSTTDEWLTISEDNKTPFSIYWNASILSMGMYRIRAIAYDANNNEAALSSGIRVMVYPSNADITETGGTQVDPLSTHTKTEKIDADQSAEIMVADGTAVYIPAQTVTSSTQLNIKHLLPSDVLSKLPPPEASLKPVGIFREFTFANGESMFPQDLTVFLPYVDDNDDGFVDGTSLKAQDLKIYYLKEDNQGNPIQWVEIKTEGQTTASSQAKALMPGLASHKGVSFKVNHFTLFAVMAFEPNSNLDQVIVYPNPVRPNYGQDLTFDNISENSELKIFTLSGRLVNTIEHCAQRYVWNLKNKDGESIQSGVYFYLLKDEGGNMAKGKFAVIR